jgi:hypothetical protein
MDTNIERMYIEIILYYYKLDKRFFTKDIRKQNDILFSILLGDTKYYYFEETFFYLLKSHIHYIKKDAQELEIPTKFCGMKDYKLMFKIMGRMQLFEEEGIV